MSGAPSPRRVRRGRRRCQPSLHGACARSHRVLRLRGMGRQGHAHCAPLCVLDEHSSCETPARSRHALSLVTAPPAPRTRGRQSRTEGTMRIPSNERPHLARCRMASLTLVLGATVAVSAGAQQRTSSTPCPPGMRAASMTAGAGATGYSTTTTMSPGSTAVSGSTAGVTSATADSARSTATNPEQRLTGPNATNGANGAGVTPSTTPGVSGSATTTSDCVPITSASPSSTVTGTSSGDVNLSRPASSTTSATPADSSGNASLSTAPRSTAPSDPAPSSSSPSSSSPSGVSTDTSSGVAAPNAAPTSPNSTSGAASTPSDASPAASSASPSSGSSAAPTPRATSSRRIRVEKDQ